MPIIPTNAVTTMSASLITAHSISPSIPETTFTSVSATLTFNSRAAFSLYAQTSFGLNSLICFSSASILVDAAMATTSKSLLALTISKVCVPIDPVEPKIDILFILILSVIYQTSF